MSRIWITGAEGMLGKTLCELCTELKIPHVGTGKKEADVTHLFALRSQARTIAPTHIVHCAAYVDVDGAEKDPERAFAVNALGAENVARVSQEIGATLIHISTDYVFDGQANQPYRETDPCHPINTYGKTKWEGEKKILALLPHACIIRTSWLFGKGGKSFISSVLQWLQEKEKISAVADQWGCPTYCPDLAAAILEMRDSQGIFHYAGTGVASRYEVALAIQTLALEHHIPLTCHTIEPVSSADFPTVARRPVYSVLHTEKISQVLGQPPRSWKLALKEYLNKIHA